MGVSPVSKFPHIVRAVAEMPWAIRPSMLAVIIDILTYRAEGHRLSEAEVAERIGAARPARPSPSAGDIAVIPITGVLAPRAAMFGNTSSSGTGIDELRAMFRMAMADPEVSGILFDVDSPGGQVDGVPEMAAEIRAARGQKPMLALSNTDAASAAYWLATAADELWVTPSGQVGSVGVFSAHEDLSAAMEMEGVKTSLISAGKYKVEGNPFEPLTDDARAEMQSKVDEYYGMFVTDLARNRGTDASTVRKDYGEGRMLTAKKAVAAGMADRIGTFDQAVDRTQRLGAGRGRAAAAGWAPAIGAAAIGRHRTATTDAPWDAGANTGRLPSEAGPLRAAHAWVDDDGDPDAKSSYKFPHHEVVSGGRVGAANTNGCSNGIAVLNGGRGGANIPDSDRAGVHAHLGGHLRDADKDVPPLRGMDSIDGLVAGPFAEHAEQVIALVSGFTQRALDRKQFRAAEDRELSAGDRQRIASLRELVAELVPVLDALSASPSVEAAALEATFAELESSLLTSTP